MRDALFACVEALYRHPPRAYHNLQHIADCLAVLDAQRVAAADPDAVEFALWLHDCVYVPQRTDNEARSAVIATVFARQLDASTSFADTVSALILATRHDGRATSPDAQLMADIDLAILGAPWPRYEAYAAGIRAEYAAVPDAVYRTGRCDFLQRMLARPAVFAASQLGQEFESTARTNLARELAALSQPEAPASDVCGGPEERMAQSE